MNEIENWYDNEYDEWARLDRHKVEYEITIRYFNKYITGNNLDILDIGGGPGRYSFFLANQGHNVTLLDLSQHNIDVAKEKSGSFGITLNDYIKGDALELNIHNQKYDVILLMGPLYHLIKETDRKKSGRKCLSSIKKRWYYYCILYFKICTNTRLPFLFRICRYG